MQLRSKDLLFGAINGGIFGLMASFILQNLDIPVNKLVFFFGFIILSIIGVYVGYLLSRIARFFFQLAKFGIVGAANTAIDFGILNLLVYFFATSGGFVEDAFKAISFSIAVINSFFWNKYWSFAKKSKEESHKEFLQFFAVSVIGAVLNVTIFHIFNSIIGPSGGINDVLWKNISAAAGAILVLSWNFVGYKFIVFKK